MLVSLHGRKLCILILMLTVTVTTHRADDMFSPHKSARRNWSMAKSVEDADFVNTFQTKRTTCQGSKDKINGSSHIFNTK